MSMHVTWTQADRDGVRNAIRVELTADETQKVENYDDETFAQLVDRLFSIVAANRHAMP
jgi:hypothetical protein